MESSPFELTNVGQKSDVEASVARHSFGKRTGAAGWKKRSTGISIDRNLRLCRPVSGLSQGELTGKGTKREKREGEWGR